MDQASSFGSSFAIRVRAKNVNGWGEWSDRGHVLMTDVKKGDEKDFLQDECMSLTIIIIIIIISSIYLVIPSFSGAVLPQCKEAGSEHDKRHVVDQFSRY